MSNLSHDYLSNQQHPKSKYQSYNSNILIKQGAGPPPPMLTQTNPNSQHRQVLHQKGQYALKETNISSVNSYPDNLSGKRPMPIVDPLYDQFIIKPPKANVTHGRIPDVEFISSEDRNFRLYPNEGDYVVQLKDEYKNVTSVTLFNASIPNTSFLIGERNNRIYLQESCEDTIIIELPVGDYNPTNLVSTIETILNDPSTPTDSTYTVELDTLTNKFIISSDLSGGDNIFNFMFFGGTEKIDRGNTRPKYPTRSIGRVLGYKRKDYLFITGTVSTTLGSTTVIGSDDAKFSNELVEGKWIFIEDISQRVQVDEIISDTVFTIVDPATDSTSDSRVANGAHKAPNKFDLSSEPFIVLNIPELENIRSNTSHIDRAFAVIPMVFPHNTKNFVVSPSSGVPPYKKYFNPPLPKLDRFTIRFLDIDGNVVNFNGIQNFMEFRILTINAPGFFDPGSLN
jgi:hypothetical protein